MSWRFSPSSRALQRQTAGGAGEGEKEKNHIFLLSSPTRWRSVVLIRVWLHCPVRGHVRQTKLSDQFNSFSFSLPSHPSLSVSFSLSQTHTHTYIYVCVSVCVFFTLMALVSAMAKGLRPLECPLQPGVFFWRLRVNFLSGFGHLGREDPH